MPAPQGLLEEPTAGHIAALCFGRHNAIHAERLGPSPRLPPPPAGAAAKSGSHLPMKVLFTDLDGTCVHYDVAEFAAVDATPTPDGCFPATALDGGARAQLLRLPPSTSGAQGVISLETLRLYAALRQLGVKIVVVSGAWVALPSRHCPVWHAPLLRSPCGPCTKLPNLSASQPPRPTPAPQARACPRCWHGCPSSLPPTPTCVRAAAASSTPPLQPPTCPPLHPWWRTWPGASSSAQRGRTARTACRPSSATASSGASTRSCRAWRRGRGSSPTRSATRLRSGSRAHPREWLPRCSSCPPGWPQQSTWGQPTCSLPPRARCGRGAPLPMCTLWSGRQRPTRAVPAPPAPHTTAACPPTHLCRRTQLST